MSGKTVVRKQAAAAKAAKAAKDAKSTTAADPYAELDKVKTW